MPHKQTQEPSDCEESTSPNAGDSSGNEPERHRSLDTEDDSGTDRSKSPSTSSDEDERYLKASARMKEKPIAIRRTGTASSGGNLERDLTNLAKFQREQGPGTLERQQKPLQIHLDVAAVEHQISSSSERNRSVPDRPGLLSHYLQLADIVQQRERLEHKQKLDHEKSQRKKIEQALHGDREKRKQRRMKRLRERLHSTSLLRNRPSRRHSGDKPQHDAEPASSSGERPSRHYLDDKPQPPSSAASTVPTSVPVKESKDAIADDSAGAGAGAESSQKTRAETSRPATSKPSSGMVLSNLRAPFSEMDLTQFLPYALSTPGLNSVIGSPAISRANSSDDLANWIKKHGQTLDVLGSPAINNFSEEALLDDRRARLLEGIQRLLLHQKFLCMLAKAFMHFGAPLHHLEDNLSRMANHLCVVATFTTMPGLILISIEDTTTFTSETKIIRCPNSYDLHRLELTDRVFRKVSKDEISVEEGIKELDHIMNLEPLFAWYWQVLDWGLSSWSVCILAFNGSWWDSLAALILGTMVGALNLLAGRLKGYTNLFEVSVSILSGFLVTVFSRWLCFGSVTLSATVVLLPGLLLTTGVIELASRNMHAGTIRVFYALMLAFIIAYGIDLGNNMFVEIFNRHDRVPDMNTGHCNPVSQWWWWLAFPVAICSICLLINIHPKQWPACVLVGGAMFSVFWLLVIHLNLNMIGPVVSAFVLGLAANIWSKLFSYNAYAILLPGMMILVPGSIGVRGIMSMFNNTGDGASTRLAVQMVQTSLSIMVGLFASSFVIYPRGKKHSALLTV
ncbi:pheromone-regulated protein prm10 [Dipsacomyces acuminosporus]|nr:pheromone-regulated protein prm10 [Dipsacomyces acuminosporus]